MSNQSVTLADSIRNIPPVTRFFTISTVIVCFANSLKIIQPHQLICYLPLFIDTFNDTSKVISNSNMMGIFGAVVELLAQSYRFFTCFLLPQGLLTDQPFHAILDIYFFYTFANHLESHTGKFRRNFPDCLWFTLVTGTIVVLLSLLYNAIIDINHFPVHHQMILSCVTYIWSRSLKNSLINFLGLVPIKAYYLPLFNLFFKLLISGYSSFLDSAIGIFSGYLYQCFQSDTLPIYNLFPGSYAKYLTSNKDANGRRVGQLNNNFASLDQSITTAGIDFIEDSIFDKGYLKAPIWLYNLLNYPTNNSKRTTAFYPRPDAASNVSPRSHLDVNENTSTDNLGSGTSTGYSWFGQGNEAFKGKGYRLGD